MQNAKAKVSDFLHKSGKHDTTVHENVAPAVVHETVKPHQHEQVTTAVDREIHQDHHHTSVQPVHDQQVLPEQHHHREGAVESRDFRHGEDHHIRAKLEQEHARFKNQTTTAATTSTQEQEPVLTGEHKHHHVHEVIQPVVHRETVEPHVVHSVNKIHEKHDHPAQVHETSTLPAMNMADFKGQGGSLTGRETRTDGFAGEPRHIGDVKGISSTAHGGGVPHANPPTRATGGHRSRSSSASSSDMEGNRRSRVPGVGGTGTHSTVPGTNTTGTHHSAVPGTNTTGTHHSGVSGTDNTQAKKPSLMDKLNPKVDANGDGKAGFMK